MTDTFPATWPGDCSRCLMEFYSGWQIGYDENDEIICGTCIRELGLAQEAEDRISSGWRQRVKNRTPKEKP